MQVRTEARKSTSGPGRRQAQRTAPSIVGRLRSANRGVSIVFRHKSHARGVEAIAWCAVAECLCRDILTTNVPLV
jgi:hypothetical protein